MNPLLLEPTDVLFFRDGRPIGGGSPGHGAAWPLPSVTNAALHAALHRAGLNRVHPHNHRSDTASPTAERKFGSLLTAGPFPVRERTANGARSQSWYFPRPLDVQRCFGCDRLEIVLRPSGTANEWETGTSSLPSFLRYAAASCRPPAKDLDPTHWLETMAYENYLQDDCSQPLAKRAILADSAIFLPEFTVGIGIDSATGTQDGERIYSAHYLRLHEGWRLGLVAGCKDKDAGNLIDELFSNTGRAGTAETHIVVGGQQRSCTARRLAAGPLPLPRGVSSFQRAGGKCRVKWVLLSPAVWPEIPPKKRDGSDQNPHPGGWLPNWVFLDWDSVQREIQCHEKNGTVLLVERTGPIRRDYSGPRHRRVSATVPIHARLVAAIVPKAIVVTGWALGDETLGEDGKPGAKPTHLAVPAGAVYYFETEDDPEHGIDAEAEARKLAAALNWHGAATGDDARDYRTIMNRRSTLFGEKGFGLGVCGTWQIHGETRVSNF